MKESFRVNENTKKIVELEEKIDSANLTSGRISKRIAELEIFNPQEIVKRLTDLELEVKKLRIKKKIETKKTKVTEN